MKCKGYLVRFVRQIPLGAHLWADRIQNCLLVICPKSFALLGMGKGDIPLQIYILLFGKKTEE